MLQTSVYYDGGRIEDMNQNVKDILKLHSQGIVTDKGFVCNYCRQYQSLFGSGNAHFKDGQILKVCSGCVGKFKSVGIQVD